MELQNNESENFIEDKCVNEIFIKEEAKRPYELSIQIKKKEYKSVYGDSVYPRTVFAKNTTRLKKSDSFIKKFKNFFGKSTHNRVVDSNTVQDTNVLLNKEKEIIDVKVSLSEACNGDNKVKNNFVVNPLTSKSGKLYLVMHYILLVIKSVY